MPAPTPLRQKISPSIPLLSPRCKKFAVSLPPAAAPSLRAIHSQKGKDRPTEIMMPAPQSSENALPWPAMTSAAEPKAAGFLLFPCLIGFIYALRVALPLLFQDDPQTGVIVATSISLFLLVLAYLGGYGGKPSVPAACFRTPVLRWMAVFFAFVLL